MPRMITASFLGLVMSGAGCASAPPPAPDPVADTASWSVVLLRKLDDPLRADVRNGEARRLAIRVEFSLIPAETVLSELLLSRVGNHVVGEVHEDTLLRIAARPDVLHIETLRGIGY